jgi:hypothetical protein
VLQANQRVEEYKRQIKSLTVKLKEVSSQGPENGPHAFEVVSVYQIAG